SGEPLFAVRSPLDSRLANHHGQEDRRLRNDWLLAWRLIGRHTETSIPREIGLIIDELNERGASQGVVAIDRHSITVGLTVAALIDRGKGVDRRWQWPLEFDVIGAIGQAIEAIETIGISLHSVN